MDYRPMIRNLPQSERPRERLRDYGAASLSPAELLAIILRSGSAGESVIAGIARAWFQELTAEHGLSEAKAAELKAALELGRRLAAIGAEARPVISSAGDVANLLLAEMGLLEQESLRTVLLNNKHAVLAITEIIRGSMNAAQVRVSVSFGRPYAATPWRSSSSTTIHPVILRLPPTTSRSRK